MNDDYQKAVKDFSKEMFSYLHGLRYGTKIEITVIGTWIARTEGKLSIEKKED